MKFPTNNDKASIFISLDTDINCMRKHIEINTFVNCKNPDMIKDLENYLISAIQAYEDEYPDIDDKLINLS